MGLWDSQMMLQGEWGKNSPVGVAEAAAHHLARAASCGCLDIPGMVRADQFHPAARVCLRSVLKFRGGGRREGEAQDSRPTELGCTDGNTTALC